MRIDEIATNKVYHIKDEGWALVLAVGKYVVAYDDPKRVTWNGVEFQTDQWFKYSNSVERRQVIFMTLNRNSTEQRVAYTTPGMVKSLCEDPAVIKDILTDSLKRGDDDVIRGIERRLGDATNGLMSICTTLAPDVNVNSLNYWEREDPLAILRHSENFPKMILLWLKYHMKTGQPINGDSNIESMIDDFREYTNFVKNAESLKQSAEAEKNKTADEKVARGWVGWVPPAVKDAK